MKAPVLDRGVKKLMEQSMSSIHAHQLVFEDRGSISSRRDTQEPLNQTKRREVCMF